MCSSIYGIAGFSCENFTLTVWLICNIKIFENFHHIKSLFVLLELFTVLIKLNHVLFAFSTLFIIQNGSFLNITCVSFCCYTSM